MPRSDEEWGSLYRGVGRLDLASAARLATVAGRRVARAEIDAALSAWAAGEDGTPRCATYKARGVPAGLVQTARDWVERDEQLAARRWFREVEHSLYGKVPVDALPAKFGLTPLDSYRPAPLFGEHNFEVDRELLGMTEAEIAEAVADGLVS
jgi:crotonobetainyl-CoA:carnitine CoA-transferase CaiB-like acyl-CoA transferase